MSRRGLIPARAGKTGSVASTSTRPRAHPRACGENMPSSVWSAYMTGSSPRVRGKRPSATWTAPPGRLIPARAGKTTSGPSASHHPPAHPRACGENSSSTPKAFASTGSSPHVRGKPGWVALYAGIGGLIPARAGKTPVDGVGIRDAWAHPRACGENVDAAPERVCVMGSSPRVRGKLGCEVAHVAGTGLIPVRAGKTGLRSRARRGHRAHPRACGENELPSERHHVPDGSSPRVRGKRGNADNLYTGDGLIPARAGKTFQAPVNTAATAAHPRACGENDHTAEVTEAMAGSSPRVRGKHPSPSRCRLSERLIPARAGKTRPRARRLRRTQAHPRACGENRRGQRGQRRHPGSSPRVRGKRTPNEPQPLAARLIPARAGKTGRRPRAPLRRSAHPRACGENLTTDFEFDCPSGSSPRVRGKLHLRRSYSNGGRLIPARAGKTPGHP